MARVRQLRDNDDFGIGAFEDLVQAHPRILEEIPRIREPNALESLIPVVGPAWDAASDLQEGDLGGAAFNTAMAIADLTPLGPASKGAKAARLGIGIVKKGSVTAGASARKNRERASRAPGWRSTIPSRRTGSGALSRTGGTTTPS